MLYSGHICHSGNSGRVVVGPLSIPEGLRRLRSEGLTLFRRALLVLLVALRVRDAGRYHCMACLRDLPD